MLRSSCGSTMASSRRAAASPPLGGWGAGGRAETGAEEEAREIAAEAREGAGYEGRF